MSSFELLKIIGSMHQHQSVITFSRSLALRGMRAITLETLRFKPVRQLMSKCASL